MVSATITLSPHLASETHGLFFPTPPPQQAPSRHMRPMVSPLSPPPPAGLGDPWSLTYPPTLPGRPMVSSLPSPLKSGSLAWIIVLITSLTMFISALKTQRNIKTQAQYGQVENSFGNLLSLIILFRSKWVYLNALSQSSLSTILVIRSESWELLF